MNYFHGCHLRILLILQDPASTINVSFSKSGLPVGLQIVADIYKDKTCFELAHFIEQSFGLVNSWPNL